MVKVIGKNFYSKRAIKNACELKIPLLYQSCVDVILIL